MKKVIFLVLILSSVVLTGCTQKTVTNLNQAPLTNLANEQRPTNQNGKIIINDSELLLSTQECNIEATTGGVAQYSLEVKFINKAKSNFNRVEFRVQDPQNNKNNLLTIGTHTATGQHWDRYGNYLQGSTFSWIMDSSEMDIVLEKVNSSNNTFSAEGYVNIKKMIKEDCPEQVWVGGHYANKGDSDYICGYEKQYLKPQKIYFKCDNGITL